MSDKIRWNVSLLFGLIGFALAAYMVGLAI